VIDKHPCRLYNIKVVIRTQGGVFMSICPKNKTSRGRRDKRRTHYKAVVPQLANDATTGELHLYHRAHWHEGKLYYRGKVVLEKEVESAE